MAQAEQVLFKGQIQINLKTLSDKEGGSATGGLAELQRPPAPGSQ